MKKILLFKRNSRLWCAVILQLLSLSAMAFQQQSVSGTVSDAQGVLPGVTITLKNSTTQTITDQNGNFLINAKIGDVLVFDYIGYLSHEVLVIDQTQIDVVLEPDATLLDEVEINAGYYTVKDRERTGSIARVTAKDIEKQPVSNPLAAMQGRMAGVSVTQETGTPGGGFTINIRGVNSLRANGNKPLYIIDGVPYSSESTGTYLTSFALPGEGNPLNSINPTDIESIEVLKDADATAIYGSRGANGVVLITTKKGKAGKTQINFSSSYGIGKVTRMMKLMDTEHYLDMRNQGFVNDGVSPGFSDYDVNGTWSDSKYTDWQKELLGGTAEINNYNISANGGSEQTQFLMSGNFRKETTVFPGDSNYKKGGVHLSLNHTSDNNKLKLFFSGRYTAQKNILPGIDFTRLARTLAPNAPDLYDEEGNLNWENSTWQNPLSNLERVSKINTNDLLVNSVIAYNITPELGIKSNFGFTELKNEENQTYPSTVYDPAYNLGSEYSSIYLHNMARQSWNIEPQIFWNKKLGNSKIDLLLGSTFQKEQASRLTAMAYGFSSNSLIYDMTAASNLLIQNNEKPQYNYQAFFGRINYTYNDRYIVNLTGRRDGSSRFGDGKQFAYFGAVGGAWLFYEESWLKGIDFLSYGKLRGSYGTTGNDQIGDYQFLDTYISSGYNYQGINGIQPARLYNPNFGWETNNKFEVALETGLFKDKILLTATWYKNRSSSQLVGIPLAGTTGFNSIQANLDATVENIGTEFTLQAELFRNKNFNWTTNFNITIPKNKLVSFPDLESSTYSNSYVVGQPITIKKLYNFIGVNPDTGLYEFEDVNGDGKITPQDDRIAVMDFSPEYFGGIQNQLSYKNWNLDFLFQFVKQLNYNYAATEGFAGTMFNQPIEYLDSWGQPGDVANHQLYTSGLNQEAIQASSNYSQSNAAVSDASFVRLKNVSLSYELPNIISDKILCRVTLQAQNLLTLTKYKGADPEFIDTGYLSPLRVISAGIQLTF